MAAVDLGSNSFHMVVARLQHGQLTIVDRLRDMVRIASGLDAHGRLRREARVRALESLHRFGERLRDMHAHQVRVVGTNTLRRARDAKPFLAAAEQALGHPVEIISGIEEARLIYVGVSHHVPDADGPMLVIDIGGGSTELIIGRGYEPRHLESLYIGCVDLSRRFFARGRSAPSDSTRRGSRSGSSFARSSRGSARWGGRLRWVRRAPFGRRSGWHGHSASAPAGSASMRSRR